VYGRAPILPGSLAAWSFAALCSFLRGCVASAQFPGCILLQWQGAVFWQSKRWLSTFCRTLQAVIVGEAARRSPDHSTADTKTNSMPRASKAGSSLFKTRKVFLRTCPMAIALPFAVANSDSFFSCAEMNSSSSSASRKT